MLLIRSVSYCYSSNCNKLYLQNYKDNEPEITGTYERLRVKKKHKNTSFINANQHKRVRGLFHKLYFCFNVSVTVRSGYRTSFTTRQRHSAGCTDH